MFKKEKVNYMMDFHLYSVYFEMCACFVRGRVFTRCVPMFSLVGSLAEKNVV